MRARSPARAFAFFYRRVASGFSVWRERVLRGADNRQTLLRIGATVYPEAMPSGEYQAKSAAVFCAAAEGSKPVYRALAVELGLALADHGIGLIYGGAKIGLMGAVADATLAAGGRVVGVIPHVLVDKEIAHDGLTELHVVDTMHTRKRLMADRASAFIAMPGGFGTLEELFEVLAWQTLKLHTKPVVLLNVAGFYDAMLTFLDVCEREGMLRGNRKCLLVATSVDDALRLAGLI